MKHTTYNVTSGNLAKSSQPLEQVLAEILHLLTNPKNAFFRVAPLNRLQYDSEQTFLGLSLNYSSDKKRTRTSATPERVLSPDLSTVLPYTQLIEVRVLNTCLGNIVENS